MGDGAEEADSVNMSKASDAEVDAAYGEFASRYADLGEQAALDTLTAERCAWCGRPHRGMTRCAACSEESKQADEEYHRTKALLDPSDKERERLVAEAVYSTLLEKGCPVAPAVTYAMAVVERLKGAL